MESKKEADKLNKALKDLDNLSKEDLMPLDQNPLTTAVNAIKIVNHVAVITQRNKVMQDKLERLESYLGLPFLQMPEDEKQGLLSIIKG